jgi:hypothetical protein
VQPGVMIVGQTVPWHRAAFVEFLGDIVTIPLLYDGEVTGSH